jgi:hypothetical protein
MMVLTAAAPKLTRVCRPALALLALAGRAWELTENFIFVHGFTSLTVDCKQKMALDPV